MGRSPCCDKLGLKKGPWTPEEYQKLLAYIEEHGHGSWRALSAKVGLQRCGKNRLAKMVIDPVTHKPENEVLLSSDSQNKYAANLNPMAQWESARLEAEASLRESKVRSHSFHLWFHPTASAQFANKTVTNWTGIGGDLESPKSALNFLRE